MKATPNDATPSDNLPVVAYANAEFRNDDIDLVALVMVLWRRRWVLVGVPALFMVLGGLAAFVKPPSYQYQAIVEIGTHVVGQSVVPIDGMSTVLNKVKDGYVPKAVATVVGHTADVENMEIDVAVPKDANVVTISAKAAESKKTPYLAAIDLAVADLLADHARIIGIKKRGLQFEINSKEQRIGLEIKRKEAEIEDVVRKITMTQSELSRQEERLSQTRSHIENVQRRLLGTTGTMDEATRKVRDEPSAMTMLLVDGQRQSGLQWLNSLEGRVVEIQNRRDALMSQIADLEQARRLKAEEIELAKRLTGEEVSLIKAREQNMLDTHVVYGPAASLEPVGLHGLKLIAIMTFIGAFLGLFAAFFADFIAKARERLKATAPA